MIVDSSVWIDFLNGNATFEVVLLRDLLDKKTIIVPDLVLAEVLQGIRHEEDAYKTHQRLKACIITSIGGEDMAVKAAHNYRQLRKQGITIRKTVDMLIGTFAIEHGLPLLFSDKDFEPMVRYLGLISVSGKTN